MTQICEPASPAPLPAEPAPFLIEFCMVQAMGFRGVAYCDEGGGWHDALTNELLPGVIEVLK